MPAPPTASGIGKPCPTYVIHYHTPDLLPLDRSSHGLQPHAAKARQRTHSQGRFRGAAATAYHTSLNTDPTRNI